MNSLFQRRFLCRRRPRILRSLLLGKGPVRERRHERVKNKKVTDANATTEAERCKSFKLRKTHFRFKAGVIHHKWQHLERQGKLYCLPIKMGALMIQS